MASLRTLLLCSLLSSGYAAAPAPDAPPPWSHGPLKATPDGRLFQHNDGTPFFWLGDTAWLISQKLNREEVKTYFENRREKGFNVVQCCVVQFLNDKSFNGNPALVDGNISTPLVTPGNNPANPAEYDYWDHLDYIIDTAAANHLYLAIAPVWSHMVRRTPLNGEQVRPYIEHLVARYKDRPNLIWLNGGSARGDQNADVWKTIGETLKGRDSAHLVSFHSFGRTQSSQWFQDTAWLDFNLFTSGHRRYDQDTEGRKIGEDNWRYVLEDLAKTPRKPTLDGEPAYENTPQGLHDHSQPYWTAKDSRRYAWWSVFAGAAGHTYGENSVRQVYIPAESKPASGAKGFIMERLDTEGAKQMRHLKNFILSRPFLGRANAQELAVGDEGEKHERILVCKGDGWLAAYAHTGRTFSLHLEQAGFPSLKGSWFNPRNGEVVEAGSFANTGLVTFNPPGEPAEGADWVLVLDDASRDFPAPGTPLLAAPKAASTAKPKYPKFDYSYLDRSADWYASPEARESANSVLRYQSREGAWPKNTNLLAPIGDAELAKLNHGDKANTIDNGATTTPLRFLARVAAATQADDCRNAVRRGIDYLLSSQYPNGGFPQFFPLRKGYYAQITYNDGAMISALCVLRDVARGSSPFEFIEPQQRERAARAVQRGLDCILRTQVRQEGRGTVWCAQHDVNTLAPAWARAYEPPSLSGCESVGIVRFLMSVEKPSPEIIAAIEDSISWFRASILKGYRVDRIKGSDGRTERVLVADPAAPALWARFYELGTNRPLYMDRHSQPLYDYAQVDRERRSGYNYHGTWADSLLERDYPAWKVRTGRN